MIKTLPRKSNLLNPYYKLLIPCHCDKILFIQFLILFHWGSQFENKTCTLNLAHTDTHKSTLNESKIPLDKAMRTFCQTQVKTKAAWKITQKHSRVKQMINKTVISSLAAFCTAKEIINKRKRQPKDWGKVCANYETDSGLVCKIYKELNKFNNKKT